MTPQPGGNEMNCEPMNAKHIQFSGKTLAETLQAMADWSKENGPDKVNIWSIDAPRLNSYLREWWGGITFVFWKD
jgi:hypothetical protein